MSQPKREQPHRELAILRGGPLFCVRGSSSVSISTPFTPPRPYMQFTSLFHAYVKWKSKLRDSCLRLGKLGPRGSHTPTCGKLVNLGSWGENLNPRAARNETNNHNPEWPLIQAFVIFTLITSLSTSTYHTRFIRSSDSSTGWPE